MMRRFNQANQHRNCISGQQRRQQQESMRVIQRDIVELKEAVESVVSKVKRTNRNIKDLLAKTDEFMTGLWFQPPHYCSITCTRQECRRYRRKMALFVVVVMTIILIYNDLVQRYQADIINIIYVIIVMAMVVIATSFRY